jgi:hypothetical protein
MRKRTCKRICCVAGSAIQASGNRSQRDRCAKVAESTLSFFKRAEAIAFTRCGCTITTRAASLRMHLSKAGQNPQASTTTCAGSGSERSNRCRLSAWLATDSCTITSPVAFIAVT